MVIEKISSRVSPVVAMAVAVIMSAGAIVLDFLTPAYLNPPIIYIAALVRVALVRKRRLLWGMTIAYIFLTLAGLMCGPQTDASVGPEINFYVTMRRSMVILALAGTAVVGHLWIRSMNVREQNQKVLQEQNDELAAGEEEIA